MICTWITSKSSEFTNRVSNIRFCIVHNILMASNYLRIFQLVYFITFILKHVYTYINWCFDSATVIFRKFIENFLNIIRLGQYHLSDVLETFISTMTFATLKSFISNLLVNIFLIDLIIQSLLSKINISST